MRNCLWHLIAPSGAVHRTLEAPDRPTARLRFRLMTGKPLPDTWLVVSAISWATHARTDYPDPAFVVGGRSQEVRVESAKAAAAARWAGVERLTEEQKRENRRAVKRRLYARTRGKDLSDEAPSAEAKRKWKRRLMADPVRWAEYLERKRAAYRVEQMGLAL